LYEAEWLAYERMQAFQAPESSSGTNDLLMQSLQHAFARLPKLQDFIITSAHPLTSADTGWLQQKRQRMFHPIEIHRESFVMAMADDRYGQTLDGIMAAKLQQGRPLESLVMIDTQLRDYSLTKNSQVFSGLKHLRVSFRSYGMDTGDDELWMRRFDFDLADVVRSCRFLKTLWLDMRERCFDKTNFDSILVSLTSVSLTDCMLTGFYASEEVLSRFLLRQQSLQQLRIAEAYVADGTWQSLFRRLSRQLFDLKTFQLYMIGCSAGLLSQFHNFSAFEETYHTVAENYVLHGGCLPEPTLRTPDRDFWTKYDSPRHPELMARGLNMYECLITPHYFVSDVDGCFRSPDTT
jgi:hypothetical protein